MPDFVFAYGSLVAGAVGLGLTRAPSGAGFLADLDATRRGWGVAMDNTVDRRGYKCYLDAAGRRPAVSVCFLDIDLDEDPPPGSRVNGACLPVSGADLEALDARERNYDRIEVSDRIVVGRSAESLRVGLGSGVRVWTYRGSSAGRARHARAVASGTAVVHAGYLATVADGFQGLGRAEWEACAPSLEPDGLPVVELVRHELS